MGFRINTNVAALNAHTSGVANNRDLNNSLEKLSSGLRINKAADDASGMAIADSLRSQANSLGQAINNANDGIGIIQIADQAMDEQISILDTIKTKATQAAQDGQTEDTRKALQADINKLLEELDNIAGTTSFNGQALLSGMYTNKEFQIGAYSNQTVDVNIGATSSDKIGLTRFETGSSITAAGSVTLNFTAVDGRNDITLESVKISTSVGTGIGALADVINKNSDTLGGITANWNLQETGSASITSGTIQSLTINGVKIGTLDIRANDNNGALVDAINDVTDQTGIEAFVDNRGRINLTSVDGRGLEISGANLSVIGMESAGTENYGRLTLTRLGSSDIQFTAAGFSSVAEKSVNLQEIAGGTISADIASAIGHYANSNIENYTADIGAGVTTMSGAMALMDIAEAAMSQLDKIRSDLGSSQNQLTSTINNISVTQVNVTSAESQIRDVDFASESANFQKYNILAQAGSYAMSQANSVQQNVMSLLQ
jgi:flagellin